ncbi:MAG: DUF3048 domain-containing protein [Chloroflexi bacterium]|nr:DUF3048 domain-containing protein [Chloroflexota bacterium]
MRFRPGQRNYACWILILFWMTTSCAASPPDLTPDPVSTAVPTLTPFQPQSESSPTPFVVAPIALQPGPTYTPYPTQYVLPESMPTPVVDVSSAGASTNFNLLTANNPLTGLPVADPALLERRPMVVKVANAPDYIRPQSGLTLADVVFEYYIEWGETRFIAVMYGMDSPMVGPVRSGRYFDEHVARMYNAFLAFKGADPRELSYLENSTLKDFLVLVYSYESICPPVTLGTGRRDSYNNAFFNTTKWAACAAKRGVDNSRPVLRGGFFSEEVPQSDLPADRIYSFYSSYSYNYWQYDPATRKYFRYQEANDIVAKKNEAYSLLFDKQTDLPVNTDNVVIVFAPHTFANQYDAKDEVYHIDLVDSGDAMVFRDGVAIPARWERTDEDQPLLLTTLAGSPIYLRPGRTFYEVMGANSIFKQDGTHWRFTFQTP